jgi:hypothetical protein
MSSSDAASSNGADVRAIGALAELELALQRFSLRGAEALAAIRSQCERNRKRLDQRAEDANREVRRRAAAVESADEDDIDDCQHALEDAREARAEIRSWQKRVEDEYQSFRRDAARFDATIDRTVSEGRGVLRSKIALLNEYRAMQVEPGNFTSSTGSISTSASEAQVDASRSDGLQNFKLPQGFVWIPLTQIRLKEELEHVQTAPDYKKVDKETMRSGMVRLQTDVLPFLSDETGLRGSDYFGEMDRANSLSYEHGIQRVYDAFFGESHIQLSRSVVPGQFDITNGRHRIRLAQELGWDAIPAQTEDASN